MSVQVSVVFSVSVIATILLYGYLSIKTSIPLKYLRRCEQKEQFKSFVTSVLSPEYHQCHLDAFWNNTGECQHLFTSYTVLRLRRELYDHGKLLIDIRNGIAGDLPDSEIEIAYLIEDTLAWFRDTANHIDAVFKPETTKSPSVRNVMDEAFRMTGRSLRT